MRIAIQYYGSLSYGLHSIAGSEGRLLQNLALTLSEYGHEIDFYLFNPSIITEQYSNIRFLDIEEEGKEYYDFYFPSIFCQDTVRTDLSKITIYLSYLKLWETARPLHLDLLKQDNVVLGYIARSYWNDYFDTGEFSKKSIYLPGPLYRELSPTTNFEKPYWCLSAKEPSSWWTQKEQKSLLDGVSFIEQLAKERGIPLLEFPVNEDYNNVFKVMDKVALLFPMYNQKSSIEAIISGTLPFPVENKNMHGLLKDAAKDVGFYLEHPFNTEDLARMIQLVSSEDKYNRALSIYRSHLPDHQFETSAKIITQALERLL